MCHLCNRPWVCPSAYLESCDSAVGFCPGNSNYGVIIICCLRREFVFQLCLSGSGNVHLYCLCHGMCPTSASVTLRDVTSSVTISSSGESGTRSLIKLQPYNGTDSLETFLAKFQRMACNIRWNDESVTTISAWRELLVRSCGMLDCRLR